MPFLRVLRDKRGYETTYLVHWYRDGNRQRSRILYVFRTPPGIRVGRDPFDPDTLRAIQAQHPDIEFDWRALRETRQIVETTPEPRRQRRSDGEAAPAEKPPVEPAAPRPAVPVAVEGETREEQLAFLARWYAELRDRVPHRTHDPVRLDALLALVERLNPESWATQEAIETGIQSASEALVRLSRVFAKRRRRARKARPAAGEDPAGPDAPVPPAD